MTNKYLSLLSYSFAGNIKKSMPVKGTLLGVADLST